MTTSPQQLLTGRVVITVPEAAGVLEISERSLRRALLPDGDLHQLSLRVGHRQLVLVTPLRALLGLDDPAANDETGPASPAVATLDVKRGRQAHGATPPHPAA